MDKDDDVMGDVSEENDSTSVPSEPVEEPSSDYEPTIDTSQDDVSPSSTPQFHQPHNNSPLTRRENNQPKGVNNPNNHQRPTLGAKPKDGEGKPDKNDVGSRKLQNATASKGRKVFNQIKNRVSKKRKNSESNGDSDNKSDENTDSDTSSDVSNDIENAIAAKAKILKIKIIIGIVAAFLIILFFMVLLSAIFGLDLSQSIPAIGPGAYNTNQFQSVYEKDSKEYKEEIAYYEKLKKVKEEYEKKHNDELKINYIHSFLIYLYYKVDVTEINGQDDAYDVNYKKLVDKVDAVVELMTPTDSSKNINYEKKGEMYDSLKYSNLFKEYYDILLKQGTNSDEIMDGIFDLAKDLDQIVYVDDTVITSETKVSTSSKKTMSIKEYIANSIYVNTSDVSNTELIKAYTVAYSTNIVSENKKLTISSNNATANNQLCSIKEGCSYDNNGNLVIGPGSRNSNNTIYYNGQYYYRRPLSSSEQKAFEQAINSVFGNVVVNADGTYPVLDVSKINETTGDYKTTLQTSYGDLKYKNVGENSYILDGSYGDKKVKTEVIFYDQKDYRNSKFCGINGYTIGGSGCGVTAMAIVASTYEQDTKYDPIYMNNEATKKGLCGGGSTGTKQAFFSKEASAMKYKFMGGVKTSKSLLNQVLKHLSQGHLVIAHMGAGHFTGGGHYMVLGGVDPDTKKVYVYDPNNRSNKGYRKTGNGWYSFNDIIVKEAYHFYIIWKG